MSSVAIRPAPLRDLIDESLDEATFLWRQWERELTSLTRNLAEIWSWTEDRLQGALDGVRAAGDSVTEFATQGLLGDEIDRITCCAGVLASTSDPQATGVLAAALRVAEGEKLSAMLRGLEVLASDHALRAAASVFATSQPASAGALCRLKSFRRSPGGSEMIAAFRSGDPAIQLDAVRVARHTASHAAERVIAAALRSDDAALTFAAVESGLALGVEEAWFTTTSRARAGGVDAARYMKLLAMLGGSAEHDLVYRALPNSEWQLDAIWALGHIGTVRAIESCIAGMHHETLARACGEAYCWITGANLERDGLAVKETLPEAPAFEDDDLDENLVPAQATLWPLPNADAVRQHWGVRRSEFAAGVRYVLGQPVDAETLLAAVESGPMLRRPDLILELAAETRGRYDVEARAFAGRQRSMMAASRSAVSNQSGR